MSDQLAAEDDHTAKAAELTSREWLLGQARWAYEQANQIADEVAQARRRYDMTGVLEWSGRAHTLRDSAREFERRARQLGPEDESPAATRALAASLEHARWSHEQALDVEREADQARRRWDIRGAVDRGEHARMLRDSALRSERDARTQTETEAVAAPRCDSVHAVPARTDVRRARLAMSRLRSERNSARLGNEHARAGQVNQWAAQSGGDTRDTAQPLGRE